MEEEALKLKELQSEVDKQMFERFWLQIAGDFYQVSSEILAENILAASVDGSQDG